MQPVQRRGELEGNEGICEAEQRMRRVRKRLRKKECKRGRKKRKGKDRKKLRTTLQLGNVSPYSSLCVVIIISMKTAIKLRLRACSFVRVLRYLV